MSRFVRLYPRAWRDRYEVEFLGLIGDRPPTPLERFDIVRGALDAHLHPQVRRRGEAAPPSPMLEDDLRLARRLGFAAIIGAVLWLTALAIAATGPVVYDDQGAYRDGAAALPFWFLAILLLAAGLLGQQVHLPSSARLARASALLAIPFLLVFGIGPWMWQFGLIAVGLLGVLALAGLRSGVWHRGASLAVVAACLGVGAIVAVAMAVAGNDRMAGGAFFLAAGLALVPAWLGVGATLIGRPIRAVA
jgi:hypothetical protein